MLTTKGMHELHVCFPLGQACGHESLSLMYEKIVLYHGKSQLTVSFLITFLMVYCVKPPIISAVPVLLSPPPPRIVEEEAEAED